MAAKKEPGLKRQLIQIKDQIPRRQRELCEYILKHFETLGLVTIKELSADAEVGISTVMRTIKALGYDNFNDFRKDLYNEALSSDSQWTLMESMEEASEQDQTLVSVRDESMDLLNETFKKKLSNSFEAAVELIYDARSISLLGTRPYKACAVYMEQLLNEFTPNVRQLSNDTETIFDKVLQLDERDVVVVFALEPYTHMVINAVKEAYRNNAKVILITDYDSNPLIQYATEIFKVAVSKSQFSIIPIIALLDAIVIELGRQQSPESIEKMQKLEYALRQNNITYYKK